MKNEIIKFLKDNVIGRELRTDDVVYSLEEGRLEGVYSDRMTFSDLTSSDNGIQFHMTTVTEEKIYGVDKSGKRAGVSRNYTGTSVFRYEIALRKSTSQMTGYIRCLSSTTQDHTMEAVVYGVYGIVVGNGQLKWKERQMFYRDSLAGEEDYRPVAFDSDVRLYTDKDKLVFEYLPVFSYVNPETMEKTTSGDKYPPFVSRER